MKWSKVLLVLAFGCPECESSTPPDVGAHDAGFDVGAHDAGFDVGARVEPDAGGPAFPPPGQEVFCLSDLTWAGCAASDVRCSTRAGEPLEAVPTCVDPDIGGRAVCLDGSGAEVPAAVTWCAVCVTDACSEGSR
jgi:hypothetical protein